jgi:putative ABC transport system permease protein
VAVAAAFLPARRAARVAPLAAMRDVVTDPNASFLRRTISGSLVTVVGAALIVAGLGPVGIAAVGLGAILVFCGVAVLGPALVRPLTRFLAVPLGRLGLPGTLANENARRNARRTAATASALMIGVGLVSFMTVVGASAKSSISGSVDEIARGDWVVSTQWGQGGLDVDVARAIDALPETEAVTGLRFAVASVDGTAAAMAAFDPAIVDQVLALDVRSGGIAQLDERSVAVQADVAADHGWRTGDRIRVEFPETGVQELTIAATYGRNDLVGPYALSLDAFDANVADPVDQYVLIADAPGVDDARARSAIDSVLTDYPTAELLTNDEYKTLIAAEIDQLLAVVYALLLLAVVIALFGIANTLALSIHERTRELGLLRALGMSRRQIRTTVRLESVIIALLGTGLGMGIGIGFGWALIRTLADQGLGRLDVPPAQLTILAVAGGIAGVLAAVNPARRASKIDILTALHAD